MDFFWQRTHNTARIAADDSPKPPFLKAKEEKPLEDL